MELTMIKLDQLDAHPANSNVMPPELLDKLVEHIRVSGNYPPVIVRPHGEQSRYQILDGHHRVAALRRIGIDEARCVIWPVDDDEAMVLMATLNRLQGQDDPRKRAALVAQLASKLDLSKLAARLPEDAEGLEQLIKLHQPPPPRAPMALENMPVAVHFFLLPEQRRQVETRLAEVGGSREAALLELVRRSSSENL